MTMFSDLSGPQRAPQPAPHLPQHKLRLVWSVALAPAYLFIGFSIMGGVPARDDFWAWAFVVGLALLAPLAVVADRVAMRLRLRLGAPDWWSLARHRNGDKAVWMAAMVAFALIPQSLIGWPAAFHWAVCWLGLIPLIFLIGEAFDSAFGRLEERAGDIRDA